MGNSWSQFLYNQQTLPSNKTTTSSSVDPLSSSDRNENKNEGNQFFCFDFTTHESSYYYVDQTKKSIVEIKTEVIGNLKLKVKNQSIAIDTMDVDHTFKPVNLQIATDTIMLPLYDASNSQLPRFLDGVSGNQYCVTPYQETPGTLTGNVQLIDVFSLYEHNFPIVPQNFNLKRNLTKEENLEKYGNRVAVIGEAGIGKTTFTKMLARQLVEENNTVLPGVEFVFYIQFRYVDYDTKCNLMEFLVKSCKCDWKWGTLDSETYKELLDSVVSSNCCFIFDGLDEAKIDFSSEAHFCPLYSENSAAVFIKNILSGDIFSKAAKLFTSRSLQLFEMHPKYRPPFILQILGFDKAAKIDMCKQICGEEKYEKAIAHLERELSFFNLCYVPVNCILIMHIINQRMQENVSSEINLTTMTDVMVSSLKNYMQSNHVREQVSVDVLTKLAHLAFNGTTTAKSIFSQNDLDKVNISKDVLDSFLNSSVKVGTNLKVKILDHSKFSFFCHLTLQELFCAIHVFYFLPTQRYKYFVTRLEESRFDQVCKFLFGFCNPQTQNQLESLFGENKYLETRRRLLFDSAIEAYRNLQPSFSEADVTKSLTYFCLLKEANLDAFAKTFCEFLPESLFFSCLLQPRDISSLVYLLQNLTKPLKLTFMPQFDQNSLDQFFKEVLMFISETNSTYIEVTELILSQNKLSLDHIKIICSCFPKTKAIRLYNCGVDYEGSELLWNAREQYKEVVIQCVEEQ